jgi:hypothetical protein
MGWDGMGGLNMDYPWITYGLFMDSPWITQVKSSQAVETPRARITGAADGQNTSFSASLVVMVTFLQG